MVAEDYSGYRFTLTGQVTITLEYCNGCFALFQLRVVISPFAYVNFADFWLADQLNSLATAFVDIYFLLCFYMTNGDWHVQNDNMECTSSFASIIIRSIVNCLPAWFRFAQCIRRYRDSKEAFPHLVNAGKYATTFIVVATNTLSSYYSGMLCLRQLQNYFFSFFYVDTQIRSEREIMNVRIFRHIRESLGKHVVMGVVVL